MTDLEIAKELTRYFHGPYKLYYDNGQLEEEITYKVGVKDGPYKVYHENGQLFLEVTYDNGRRRDGPYKEYHDNGQLSIEGTYKDGYFDGYAKSYYKNGEFRSEGTFYKGTRSTLEPTRVKSFLPYGDKNAKWKEGGYEVEIDRFGNSKRIRR